MAEEAFDHPRLGRFEHDIADEVWVARGSMAGRTFDLAVLGGEDDPAPPAPGLERLTLATGAVESLLEAAIEAIGQARVMRLDWSAGPDIAAWTVLALVSDRDAALWMVLLEPASDEYSSWWAGFDRSGGAREVRRGAAGASYDPHSARPV